MTNQAHNPSKPEMTYKMVAVAHDNERVHQFGGQHDGISPEVAADIGFPPTSELGSTVSGAEELKEAVARLGTPADHVPLSGPELARATLAAVRDKNRKESQMNDNIPDPSDSAHAA